MLGHSNIEFKILLYSVVWLQDLQLGRWNSCDWKDRESIFDTWLLTHITINVLQRYLHSKPSRSIARSCFRDTSFTDNFPSHKCYYAYADAIRPGLWTIVSYLFMVLLIKGLEEVADDSGIEWSAVSGAMWAEACSYCVEIIYGQGEIE